MFRSWQTLRSIPRLRQILMVVARHGFGHALSSVHIPLLPRIGNLFRKKPRDILSQPQRFRCLLEELGPTFIKFGQLLATRPDLLPFDYIVELERLHDQAEPLPFKKIKSVLREELGKEPRELFSWIEETPIGSASIAQAHRARTRDGKEVVVKIQRPGIQRTVRRDLQILFLVAGLLAENRNLAHLDPVGTVRVFERSIKREMDFRHELHNMERIARVNKDKQLKIPKSYRSLSGKRVLTAEFLPGKHIRKTNVPPELSKKLARALTHALFHQIFQEGVFHADPHPGNLLLLPDQRLGLIDFGNTGLLNPNAIVELTGFTSALIEREYTLLASQILRNGYASRNIDRKELAAELMDGLDPYYGLPLSEVDIGTFVSSVFGILMRFRIRIPRQYVLLGRTLAVLEGTVRELDPGFSVIEELRPQAKRILLERWKPNRLLRGLRVDLYDLTKTLREMPGGIGELLQRFQEGNLRTKIALEDIKEVEKRLDRLSLQLPMGLLASSFLLSGTILLALASDSRYGVTAGVVSYVLAGLLGIWVMRPRGK